MASFRPAPPPTADSHVHSEWSWDAELGSMEETCRRALELGLPALAFTEHWDPTPCAIALAAVPHLPPLVRQYVSPEGVFQAPSLDVEGYLARLAECRGRFPALRILSGVELGEPHWWPKELAKLQRTGEFDRILGSVHCVAIGDHYEYIDGLYNNLGAKDVVVSYLTEVLRLVESSAAFEILAHIDYPVRNWPAAAGRYRPEAFEDECRAVLRALARSGRALELNTTVPLHAEVVRWWRGEGGAAVTLASDAHQPGEVARGFAAAAALLESLGFTKDAEAGLWRVR
jgi:histidinol-phosphatase (PHP family)